MRPFARFATFTTGLLGLACMVGAGCHHRYSYSSNTRNFSVPGAEFSCQFGNMNGELFIDSQELVVTGEGLSEADFELRLLVFQDRDRDGKYKPGRDRKLAVDIGMRRDIGRVLLDNVQFRALKEHEPVHYRWVVISPDGTQTVNEAQAST